MAGVGRAREATAEVQYAKPAEVQYAKAKTMVWWDIENCHVPKSCNLYSIAQNVKSALTVAGYRGAVTVSAFGDTTKINPVVQEALTMTGVSMNHVPSGMKDASGKKNLAKLFMWGLEIPCPANILLISGNREFSDALHQLRMMGYNILLAHPNPIHVSQALVAAAAEVWLWTSLVSGGPPLDGPNKSRSTAEKPSRSMMEPAKPANCTEKDCIDGGVGSRDIWRARSHPNALAG